VAEEECDSPEVILDLLEAGPCSAAEAGEALPQRVVEAREMVGVACFLRDGLVTLSRDDTLGDVLLIGLQQGLVLVDRRDRSPHGWGTLAAALADRKGHPRARGSGQGEPHPVLVGLLLH